MFEFDQEFKIPSYYCLLIFWDLYFNWTFGSSCQFSNRAFMIPCILRISSSSSLSLLFLHLFSSLPMSSRSSSLFSSSFFSLYMNNWLAGWRRIPFPLNLHGYYSVVSWNLEMLKDIFLCRGPSVEWHAVQFHFNPWYAGISLGYFSVLVAF